MRQALATLPVAAAERGGCAATQVVEIPVRYDGPDLAEVAELTGLSVREVIAAHTGTDWRVAFGGFAPGFAYLSWGDPRLAVPRRQEPRTSVPAGSVALAGSFSAIYPRSSPGGWQLIGHTDVVVFDVDRGTTRPAATGRGRALRRGVGGESMIAASRALEVLDTGPLALVQDLGRIGLAAIGVGRSGAADRGAFRLGARLLAQPYTAAALEVTFGGLSLRSRGELQASSDRRAGTGDRR